MVFDFFEKISSIPRGSGNNEGISNFLVEFAKEHGLRYVQDEVLNVVIYKDATPGYEQCPPLIFQGHMDMVCEKTKDSDHDFTKDPIKFVIEDGFITADGTTLGADDGIAVAYMLDILCDDTLIHPPLEMLITTDEEVGMLGAAAFDTSHLKGRHMINLDSEDEGVFVAACAGGITTKTTLAAARKSVCGVRVDIDIKGLKGGHSGTEINKNRTNAVLLGGRVLTELPDNIFSLLSINGGNKDNVIPNEVMISVVVSEADYESFIDLLGDITAMLKTELKTSEPGLIFDIKPCGKDDVQSYMVLDDESCKKLINYFAVVPNGVHVMSSDIPGMVESSSNLGIMRCEENRIISCVSARSQKASYIRYICKKLLSVAELVGAEFETGGAYPGWDIQPDSKFRDMLCQVYKEQSGKEAVVESIHAGLEGGIFSDKIPGIDIVSMGPDVIDIHTVNERVSIESVKRMHTFLLKAIQEFALMNKGE